MWLSHGEPQSTNIVVALMAMAAAHQLPVPEAGQGRSTDGRVCWPSFLAQSKAFPVEAQDFAQENLCTGLSVHECEGPPKEPIRH